MSEPRRVSAQPLLALLRPRYRGVSAALVRAALTAIEAWRRAHPERADAEPARETIGERAAVDLRAWIRRAVYATLPRLTVPRETEDRLWEQAGHVARLSGQRAAGQLVALGAHPAAVLAALDVRTADPGPLAIAAIDVGATEAGQAAIRRWVAEGLDLVSTYPRDALDGIEGVLARHLRAGTRWETLRDALQARVGMSERHAELVARDQTGRLQARISADLQASAGVQRYRWRTARDQRVRDRHRELEGTVWDVDGPGAPGAGPYGEHAHAGEAIQCRCYREPIVDDVPALRRPPRGVETVPEQRPVPPRPPRAGVVPRALPLTQRPRRGPLRERGE